MLDATSDGPDLGAAVVTWPALVARIRLSLRSHGVIRSLLTRQVTSYLHIPTHLLSQPFPSSIDYGAQGKTSAILSYVQYFRISNNVRNRPSPKMEHGRRVLYNAQRPTGCCQCEKRVLAHGG